IISPADITVRKDDQGGILVKSAMDAKPVHYTETEPQLYERTDDTDSLMDKGGMDTSRIAFEFDDDGKTVKMSYGIVSDYLPVAVKDRRDINLLILIVSILTFTACAVTLAIRWFMRKRRKQDKPASSLA